MCDRTINVLPMPISSARMPPPVSEGGDIEKDPVIECLYLSIAISTYTEREASPIKLPSFFARIVGMPQRECRWHWPILSLKHEVQCLLLVSVLPTRQHENPGIELKERRCTVGRPLGMFPTYSSKDDLIRTSFSILFRLPSRCKELQTSANFL